MAWCGKQASGSDESQPQKKDEQGKTLSKFEKSSIVWLKHVAARGWQIFTKSFWETVSNRIWPQ
jgi:hypothetical protein